MKSLLIVLLLSGCTSWQQAAHISLSSVKEIAEVSHRIGRERFDDKCMSEAETCKTNSDNTCLKLEQCQKERRDFVKVIQVTLEMVSSGYLAVTLGDERDYRSKLGDAVKLAIEVHAIAEQMK